MGWAQEPIRLARVPILTSAGDDWLRSRVWCRTLLDGRIGPPIKSVGVMA
jgi:hypothetical protein